MDIKEVVRRHESSPNDPPPLRKARSGGASATPTVTSTHVFLLTSVCVGECVSVCVGECVSVCVGEECVSVCVVEECVCV